MESPGEVPGTFTVNPKATPILSQGRAAKSDKINTAPNPLKAEIYEPSRDFLLKNHESFGLGFTLELIGGTLCPFISAQTAGVP